MSGFAETLERAIAAQPLTLERISAYLREAGTPASVTTLSYWQTGRSLPTRSSSRKCVAQLDHILGLHPGTLLAALDALPSWQPADSLPAGQSSERLVHELGLDLRHVWTKIGLHDRLVVDASGRESTQRVTQLLRAEVEDAVRWPIVMQQDTDVAGSVATIRPIAGLEVEQVLIDPDDHLTVAAMTLPAPVARGSVVHVEFEIVWGPQSERSTDLGYCLASGARSLVLEVQFRGDAPRRLRRYWQAGGDSERRFADDVRHDRGWAQSVIMDPGPGFHGISWDW